MEQVNWAEFYLDILKTAIGFFIALIGNDIYKKRLDKKAYYTMLKAILNEASSNETIYKDSFMKFYPDGMVLRGFNFGTVEKYLAEPLFVRHAEPHVLKILYSYLREIKLANAYREKDERFKLELQKEKTGTNGVRV